MPSITQTNRRGEFQEKGYVIVRNFFSEAEMNTLIEDITG